MSEIDENTVKPASTAKPKKTGAKAKTHITDSTLIKVKSCTFGKLVYRNSQTGERYEWNKRGVTQIMPFAELRAMRTRDLGFFKNQLIIITGPAEEKDEDITAEDIYRALLLQNYFKNIVDLNNISAILKWSDEEIVEKVKLLPASAKENFVRTLNSYIRSGRLDSMKKIKAFEKALGCDLATD